MTAPRPAGRARWTASGAWTAVVLALLLTPIQPSLPGVSGIAGIPLDKLAHVGLFAPFAWLWLRALGGRSRRAVVAVLLLSACVGGGAELLQAFVPHRSPEWADLAADLVGAALGCLLPWATGQRVASR